jgi:hypothetical protein
VKNLEKHRPHSIYLDVVVRAGRGHRADVRRAVSYSGAILLLRAQLPRQNFTKNAIVYSEVDLDHES